MRQSYCEMENNDSTKDSTIQQDRVGTQVQTCKQEWNSSERPYYKIQDTGGQQELKH